MSSHSQELLSVSVVVLAYGWSERTSDFFGKVDVVVVENNPLIKHRKHEHIKLISNKKNVGFAKAANEATRLTDSTYLLFLNDDCELNFQQIQELVASAKAHGWKAISPSLVGADGCVQTQYAQPLPVFSSLFSQWTPLHRLGMQIETAQTLPGACLLIERQTLLELGGWDERLWLWWEDADLSLRLHQADIPFGIDSDIQVTHRGGESFAPLDDSWKRQVFFHSLRVLSKKHFSSLQHNLLSLTTRRFDHHKLYPVDPGLRASIVVPNVKKALLETFLKQQYPLWDWTQDELIIVTSATDLSDLKQLYPLAVWIELDRNDGFASTVNIGLRRARGKWIGTVNDDTLFSADLISHLVAAEGPRIGSLSPLIKKVSGDLESAGVQYLEKGKAEPILHVPQIPTAVDTVNAAAVLFSHEALEAVGLFDELFGSYLEDVDLGLRLAKAGWKNVVVPQASVTHLAHQTSASRPIFTYWLNVKNWWLLLLKNYSLSMWLNNFSSIMVERLRNISGLLKVMNASQPE